MSVQHNKQEKSHHEGHYCEISDNQEQEEDSKNIQREDFTSSIYRIKNKNDFRLLETALNA